VSRFRLAGKIEKTRLHLFRFGGPARQPLHRIGAPAGLLRHQHRDAASHDIRNGMAEEPFTGRIDMDDLAFRRRDDHRFWEAGHDGAEELARLRRVGFGGAGHCRRPERKTCPGRTPGQG